MSETTPITVLSLHEFDRRIDSGLMVPMHQGEGLRVIDCGDERPLTEQSKDIRTAEQHMACRPGRLYGGASGFAMASLMTLSVQLGEKGMNDFIDNFSPEAFIDFGADISDRAHDQAGIHINQHSALANENDPTQLADYRTAEKPLGCAFNVLGGLVLSKAAFHDLPLLDSMQSLRVGGDKLPVHVAQQGAKILSKFLPESFGVHRGALDHAARLSGKHVPIAIHEGSHYPNEQTGLVIDFAGYRSSTKAHVKDGIPRYHHTPGLVSELLPTLLPEYELDASLLEASSLLLGMATRLALSGETNPHALTVEVIPRDIARAA